MKIFVILFFLLFPLLIYGITIRVGVEGPALIGATIEANNGLYLTFGGFPPLNIFGSGGPWTFSLTGGYIHLFEWFDFGKTSLNIAPRIGMAAIISESFYIAAIPGFIIETSWKISKKFKLGLQAGINLGIILKAEDMNINLVPIGQLGIHTKF